VATTGGGIVTARGPAAHGHSFGPPQDAGLTPFGAQLPGRGYDAGLVGPRQKNEMATASLVCGLFGLVPLWVGFTLCILAITFGAIGLNRAAVTGTGRAKAIAGLVLGSLFFLPAMCGL
jgi:hypothetical protein